jgi:hypothetical protein
VARQASLPRAPRGLARVAALAAVLLSTTSSAPAAAPRLSVEESLRLAFPGCALARSTVFLTAEQVRRVEEAAGSKLPSAIAHPYRATCPTEPGTPGVAGGTAYFEAHTVRTLPETLMIVIDPKGRVRRVEVLAFLEPPEYLPREIWYRQFDGKALDEDLSLRGAIRPVAGASLTARSTTDAVRRVLALHQVLSEAKP